MKTIYFYGIDNNRGGMETYALNLIRGILANCTDYKFHILTIFENFAFKNIGYKNISEEKKYTTNAIFT